MGNQRMDDDELADWTHYATTFPGARMDAMDRMALDLRDARAALDWVHQHLLDIGDRTANRTTLRTDAIREIYALAVRGTCAPDGDTDGN